MKGSGNTDSNKKQPYTRNRSFSHYNRGELPNPQTPYAKGKNTLPQSPLGSSISFPVTQSHTVGSKYKNEPKNQSILPPLGNDRFNNSGSFVYSSTRSNHGFGHVSERYIQNESVFEAFLINAMEMKLSSAIEETISITLKAHNVIFWQDIPSLHILYSEKLHRTVSHSSGVVGFTFFSRELTKIESGQKHASYSEDIDSDVVPIGKVHAVLFPLWDYNGNVCGVVEITREMKEPMFDDNDIDFIQFFVKKFKLFSHWIGIVKFPHELVGEMLQSMEVEQFMLVIQRNMTSLYNCKSCEIWEYDTRNKELHQFYKDRKTVDPNQAGIVWESLTKGCPINCSLNKMQSSYNSVSDGTESEPVLIVPLDDVKLGIQYAIVLRGRKEIPVFTRDDETSLREVAPYLALALQNNIKNSQSLNLHGNAKEHLCFEGLLDTVDRLVLGTPVKDVVKMALEQLQLLVNADRCYLFKYDQTKESLVTIVHTGVKNPLSIAIDHGIVGRTFRGNKIFNIPNAYDDMDFDASLDHDSNYLTRTLISVPVINNRKETIGVIQFLNKRDGKPFSNSDAQFIRVFSTFVGMMLENDKMYTNSFESTQQLRSFLNVSLSLSSNQSVKTILSDIMQNARTVINAERASLFLIDNVLNVLTSYIADGGKMPLTITLSNGIAATAATKKIPIIVNDAYHDPRFNKMIDYHSGFKTKSLLAVPVVGSDGNVLGVAEMINKLDGTFTNDDLKLLQSFATFSAMSLEARLLRDINERGQSEIEMSNWIGDMEKSVYSIPTKLMIPVARQSEITGISFFCIEWNGIGLFKVAYFIFSSFNLLEYFEISNHLFFTFLYRLREEYNEPPYHNWIHAIDVLQYVFYQVKTCNFENTLTKLELLALCVAAVCHDAGHQGFNNVYNVRSETPLGILFKDQSVMETHHCTIAIRIISREESNIFHKLNPQELKKVWSWICHLILSTDMAHHFKLVKQANDIIDEGSINLSSESHRLMGLTMLLKVADISNVSRPFEIAGKWCDVLCEEFYRQGDMEKSQGLDFSSPLNDREHQDVPKGQIGFYNFICLPLYQGISRIFPELKVNAEAVKENLEKWKQIAEANAISNQ